MAIGEFAAGISDPFFIILHLLGLILAIVFAVRASHNLVPKTIVAAFVFWGILELSYILGYIKLFNLQFSMLLGEIVLFVAFILIMVGSSE
ncbi:MAG: hypothetical protein AABW87_03785 [Nanoarchaeota archaeon]